MAPSYTSSCEREGWRGPGGAAQQKQSRNQVHANDRHSSDNVARCKLELQI